MRLIMKKVILISGKLQSGKNQLAAFLQKRLEDRGLSVGQDYFAKDVKDGVKKDFKIVQEYLGHIHRNVKEELIGIGKRYGIPIETEKIMGLIDGIKYEDENLYEDKTELTRFLLQIYGTEIFRERVGKDWWTTQLTKRCAESTDDIILLTDVRFENEIEVFDNLDGVDVSTVRVERNINRNGSASTHNSETGLDDYTMWDYIIENDGDLALLDSSAATIIDLLYSETK
jgi:hypothetical protein